MTAIRGRRDSTGSQSSARPEGTSPDRSSRNGDIGRLSVVGLTTPKVECNACMFLILQHGFAGLHCQHRLKWIPHADID